MDNIISIIENYVEDIEITENSSFKKDLALSSFDIVCIVGDIKDSMNIDLNPRDFIEYNTVGKMYSYIESIK